MSEIFQPNALPNPNDWVIPHVVKITETVTQLAALGQASNEKLNALARDFEDFEKLKEVIALLNDRLKQCESSMAAHLNAEKLEAERVAREDTKRDNDRREYKKEAWKAAAAAVCGGLVSQGHNIYKWFSTLHH